MNLKTLLKPWWAKLLLVAAVGGAGWAGYRTVFPPSPPPPPPNGEVVKGDITQIVQAAGVLQAKIKVDVGAQVSGQVQTLHVQLGQKVKKGELLVSLDPELARNDVARAEAALLQQRALLDARMVDLSVAQRELARQKRLLAGQASAALELERAESELAKLEADVRGQTAVLTRLQTDLAQAQVRLGYTRIKAPMNGTVVNIPVQEGQTVIAVQITPVMLTLADLDTITVRTKVPEVDIQAVKVGQKASFLTLSGEGQRYGGTVRVVQPVPERSGNAVFYNVLFDVDNQDGKLFSEMTVQVDIETGEAKGILTMPMVALGERAKDGRFAVTRLDKDGKQQSAHVRTGLQDGAKVEVREGLTAGDKVLLAPPSAASAPAGAASSSASGASS
jgi:macrolide-specific efflux system membrane fusion protein